MCGKGATCVQVKGCRRGDTFYSWELQRVIKPMDTYFKIEKIIDQKTEGRKIFYLVKYKGYPEKFNASVPAKDVKKL